MTRIEYVMLFLVLAIAVMPLIQEGGLARLLWEGTENSQIDPSIIYTTRLGMVLLLILGIVKVLGNRQ